MKKRHKQEREKVAERLDAEEDKEERVLTKDLDSEREKLLREKRNRQATELSSRKDLTEEQIRDVSLYLSKKRISILLRKRVLYDLFIFLHLKWHVKCPLKRRIWKLYGYCIQIEQNSYTGPPSPLQNYCYLHHWSIILLFQNYFLVIL